MRFLAIRIGPPPWTTLTSSSLVLQSRSLYSRENSRSPDSLVSRRVYQRNTSQVSVSSFVRARVTVRLRLRQYGSYWDTTKGSSDQHVAVLHSSRQATLVRPAQIRSEGNVKISSFLFNNYICNTGPDAFQRQL